MAKNKKSVLLYCDLIHTVEQLDDVDAGLLFKHYLRYINDMNPEPPSRLIQIVFEPIKQTLKRDLDKWESKRLKNSNNAKMRWDANACERIKNDANHAVIVSDIVSDIVSVKDIVNVKDIDINKSISFNAKAFMSKLGYDNKLIDEWFYVRKIKQLSNSQTAIEAFHNEVLKTKKPINEILKLCVEKSWGGFKYKWLEENNESITIRKKQIIN